MRNKITKADSGSLSNPMSRRNGRYIAAFGGLILAVSTAAGSLAQPPASEGEPQIGTPAHYEKATKNARPETVPIISPFVKVQDRGQPSNKKHGEPWWMVLIRFFDAHNGSFNALAAIAVAIFTYFLWRLNVKEINALGQQSRDVERSIAEAARAANAMERVADEMAVSAQAAQTNIAILKDRTAQQMRAYLTVLIGSGTYQERHKNLKFAGQPVLKNTGNTPAHDVRFRAKAAILPLPLPDDYHFTLPEADRGGAVLAPGQDFGIGATVDDYVPDGEVDGIKSMDGRALYVWGVVRYRDVFRVQRRVTFCQFLCFTPDGKVQGWYTPKHNRAN